MRQFIFWIALITVLSFVGLTVAQLPKVDQRKVCLECHDDLVATLAKPKVHQPVKDGECSACHAPHASRHEALLMDKEAELCASCHTEAAEWPKLSHQHDPVARGECTRCHDPHAADKADLLNVATKDLCITCHVEVRDWLAKPNTHAPMRVGQCAKCHNVHGGSHDNLLTQNLTQLCKTCHGNEQRLRERHVGFDPVNANCSACHDPHASDSPSLVMSNKHAPFEDKDCAACHVAKQTADGYPLKGAVQKVCGECHEAEAAHFAQYKPHGATEENSCQMCHNGHAADQRHLLTANEKTLCVKCHDPSHGVKVVGDNPHARYACGKCHEAHGNTNAGYLKKPSLELCAECHKHQHQVAHPMGEKVTNPLTGGPLDCISCHDLHSWTAAPLMIASADRALCVRCHRDK